MPPKKDVSKGLKEFLEKPENVEKRKQAIAKNKAVREAKKMTAVVEPMVAVKPKRVLVRKPKVVEEPKMVEQPIVAVKPKKVSVKKPKSKKLNIPTISSIRPLFPDTDNDRIYAELDTFSIEIFDGKGGNNPRDRASKQELHNEYIHFTKDIQKYYTEDEFKQIMTNFTSRKFRVYCFYIPSKDRKSGLVIMEKQGDIYNPMPLYEYDFLPFITTYIPELDRGLRTFYGLDEYYSLGVTFSGKKYPAYPPGKFKLVKDFIKTNTGIEI